ncbi:unnamed protein product [Staurois parvus]|uniref:Uncharacterized protein n=1 Tax=Staurois parvus TaxID=386267 RepID=A0ABN9DGG1_9NEOB|nr:unnamed protein product [Staurois parvus]
MERAEDVGSILCSVIIRVLMTSPQQCHRSVSISASSQCSSMPPASAHQCHISVPHQCHIAVPI